MTRGTARSGASTGSAIGSESRSNQNLPTMGAPRVEGTFPHAGCGSGFERGRIVCPSASAVRGRSRTCTRFTLQTVRGAPCGAPR